jgi:hypothetical protein
MKGKKKKFSYFLVMVVLFYISIESYLVLPDDAATE